MPTQLTCQARMTLFSLTLALVSLIPVATSAQGIPPRITFQGVLTDSTGPIVGSVDLDFFIYDLFTGGTSLWSESHPSVVTGKKGEFAVVLGSSVSIPLTVWGSADRYLEIVVNAGSPLVPRTRFLSVPYAYMAARVVSVDGASGGVMSGNLTVGQILAVDSTAWFNQDLIVLDTAKVGSFKMGSGAANGAYLQSDATGVGTWQSGNFWRLNGNAGLAGLSEFLGTTDDKPLSFRVNNLQVMRITPGLDNGATTSDETAPNLIGGHQDNDIATDINGAVVGGGGYHDTVAAVDARNRVTLDFGTIGGGTSNRAADWAAVAGGAGNQASGRYSAIPGGILNIASGTGSFAAGSECKALGERSVALGQNASVTHDNSFLWSNSGTTVHSNADNQFKVRADSQIVLSAGHGVCINCMDAGSFALAVDGTIGAREVVVTQADPWPDYVFQEDYPLTDLPTLSEQIRDLGHLPGVPSAAEVEDEGVSLGQMQATLLEKVEELTLHLITLDESNRALRAEVERLTIQIEAND